MNKKCFKCKETKPIKKFYKHPKMADGHIGKCIECSKKYIAEYLIKKSKDKKWMAKELERHRKKSKKFRMENPKYRSKNKSKNSIIWAKRNPEKYKAHYISTNAIRSGKLNKKEKCEKCGASGVAIEKHHPDYSKPLSVIWLCKKCHGKTRWIY